MLILLKSIHRTQRVEVQSTDSGGRLKEIAAEEFKICPQNIDLLYKGIAIQDSQPLSAYTLCDGCVVIIVSWTERFPLSIDYYGKQLNLEVPNSAKIAQVKDMISPRIYVQSERLTLFKDQIEVQDVCDVKSLFSDTENRTLVAKSSQHVDVTEGFMVIVKTLTGKVFQIQIADHLNIHDVRCIIAEETGLDVETIRLIYAGRDMCDDMVVGTIRITPYGTLYVVLRLR